MPVSVTIISTQHLKPNSIKFLYLQLEINTELEDNIYSGGISKARMKNNYVFIGMGYIV